MKTKLLIALMFLSAGVLAQESMEKTMEKRAKEMHRVMGLTDKSAWEKFVKENYSKTLIDKPMKARVVTSDNEGGSEKTETKTDMVAAKAAMFNQLHQDFGDSKISSIKTEGENLTMVLTNADGMTGTFSLKFDKTSPYLIGGLGIAVEMQR